MPSHLRFEITASDAGERVDVCLARCGELSRSALQRLCDEGRVTLGGVPVTKKHRVSAGDVYEAVLPEPVPDEARPQDIPLAVVYEDEDILVIDKPRGLVVHPAAGHAEGTLVNALLHHCAGALSGVGGVARPGIVHRIDKDTSGLLVVAKHDAAHRHLAGQLSRHDMSRVYEALAYGTFRLDSGVVSGAIGRDPRNRKRMAVVTVGGKEAVTHYRVLARLKGATHVECRLETGRTHQIRVHMRHIGHPLLGDTLYGGPDHWGLQGQCLHARELRLIHPRSDEAMVFVSDTPPYFTEMLSKVR